MKKKLWLCDIDGTVALKGDRSPFDWAKVGEDLPNIPVVKVIQTMMGNHEVGFISGRMEQCRDETEIWLYRYHLTGEVPVELLWMRKDGDNRPDDIVKREIYDTGIAPYFDVQGVFDDRDKVVKMWRELGLTCLQVAEGNF